MRMAEHGSEGGKLHFHVLLAGARCITPQNAVELWIKVAGTAVIGLYDKNRRGLEYALKSIEDGPDYDFDASLHDEHLLPRFRKLATGSN